MKRTCTPNSPTPTTHPEPALPVPEECVAGNSRAPEGPDGACPFFSHLAYSRPGMCPKGCHSVVRYVVLERGKPPSVPVGGYSREQSEHLAMRVDAAERQLRARNATLEQLMPAIDQLLGKGTPEQHAVGLRLMAERRRKRARRASPPPEQAEPGSPSLTEKTQADSASSEGASAETA